MNFGEIVSGEEFLLDKARFIRGCSNRAFCIEGNGDFTAGRWYTLSLGASVELPENPLLHFPVEIEATFAELCDFTGEISNARGYKAPAIVSGIELDETVSEAALVALCVLLRWNREHGHATHFMLAFDKLIDKLTKIRYSDRNKLEKLVEADLNKAEDRIAQTQPPQHQRS